jgi:hypothetical protein
MRGEEWNAQKEKEGERRIAADRPIERMLAVKEEQL